MREPWVAVAILAGTVACGGADKKTEEPAPVTGREDVESVQYEDVDGTLVPPEKYEEIQLTLSRRGTQISRCYSDAMEGGAIDRTARGTVVVELTVEKDGRASGVRVLPTSTLKSDEVWACSVEAIERVRFTTLPRSLPFTYTYKLERDY